MMIESQDQSILAKISDIAFHVASHIFLLIVVARSFVKSYILPSSMYITIHDQMGFDSTERYW